MYKLRLSLSLLGIMCLSLSGCGSTPERTANQPVLNNQVKEDETEQINNSPEYYLLQAEQAFAESGDKFLRNQWILRAASAYQQLQQCHQVNKIIALTLPELVSQQLTNHAHLLDAECISMTPPIDYQALADKLDTLDPALGYRNRINKLQLSLLTHRKKWLASAKLRLQTNLDSDMDLDVWYLLQNLTTNELEAAALREPALMPYLQLSLITRRFGLDIASLRNQVALWQSRYDSHPLSLNLPEELQLALNLQPNQSTDVAVLLPLSGRLASQGLAIKQGVLAAYINQQASSNQSSDSTEAAKRLRFFDTNLLKGQALAEQVKDYPVIIGPLMKDEIEAFLPFAPIQADIIALNQVDQKPVAILEPAEPLPQIQAEQNNLVAPQKPGKRIYFALSPEDEAWQLASKVYAYGVRHPIVVSQQGGASRRMAEAFLQHWQRLQDRPDFIPALATFTDNKSMRTSVTTLLDVAQSNTRIDQVKYLTQEQIHSVPRNRRDVDGIIIFASAQQTELLNPIIESSLSPFNDKTVPVFGSSRSYSKNLSNNSLRDLRNLTFSDMPWMLPNHPWQSLAQEVESNWPSQDDTLSRLFALGFDAFTLTSAMPNLDVLPQLSMSGLTGQLSVDQTNNVNRQLSMGRIGDNRVERVEMD